MGLYKQWEKTDRYERFPNNMTELQDNMITRQYDRSFIWEKFEIETNSFIVNWSYWSIQLFLTLRMIIWINSQLLLILTKISSPWKSYLKQLTQTIFIKIYYTQLITANSSYYIINKILNQNYYIQISYKCRNFTKNSLNTKNIFKNRI